jgi:hypothetical protein
VTVILDIFVDFDNDSTTVPVKTEEELSEGGPLRIKGFIGSKDNLSCVNNPKCISK